MKWFLPLTQSPQTSLLALFVDPTAFSAGPIRRRRSGIAGDSSGDVPALPVLLTPAEGAEQKASIHVVAKQNQKKKNKKQKFTKPVSTPEVFRAGFLISRQKNLRIGRFSFRYEEQLPLPSNTCEAMGSKHPTQRHAALPNPPAEDQTSPKPPGNLFSLHVLQFSPSG